MFESFSELPEVEPQDPEPVAVAIETARALFRSGDRMDALRWLRRAAERAEEAGDDLRAVNLAHRAADLSTALQSSPPPPTSRRDEAAALAPYDDFSDKTLVDALMTLSPNVREVPQAAVQIKELNEGTLPPRSATLPSPSSSTVPVVDLHQPLPVPAVPLAPVALPAYRVAIAPDPQRAGTWTVSLLPEGVPAAPGWEEALVVALSATGKLFQ